MSLAHHLLRFAALATCAWLTCQPAAAQTTERVSIDSAENQATGGYSAGPAVSGDGRFVVFYASATNLVAGDTNARLDIFVRDRQSGSTERVSVSSAAAQANGDSYSPAISADGRFVVFHSYASGLVAPDTNNTSDVFVRDLEADTTVRVSVDSGGNQANGGSYYPSISADGRFVAFASDAGNLVADDENGRDIFVHDRETGATERVSVDSAGVEGDGDSEYNSSVSADGRFVAFASNAGNLVVSDTNGVSDIFVRDRQTGETERVSVNSAGAQGNSNSYVPAISADGRFVAFHSDASNLVAGDGNSRRDIFVHDRDSGTTVRVSVDSLGGQANGNSLNPRISADGGSVVFESLASNLVPDIDGNGVGDDTNNTFDAFVHNRQSGATERVSVNSAEAQADAGGASPAISGDARFVAFYSSASNLVADDTNGAGDIFLRSLPVSVIAVSAAPAEGGSVSGWGTFATDSERTVTATPSAHWRFVNWTEDVVQVSTLANYTFTLNDDRDLIANFVADDTDTDGVPDVSDNCPLIANAAQTNTDGDGEGDACDPDDDGDTVDDGADNCPLVANAAQTNTDGDGFGDACDSDDDEDGVVDANDNCPLVVNADQADLDGDGPGDACDSDDDGDNVADTSDNCPMVANAAQTNTDGDGFGDACDGDDDNDGDLDAADNCPLVSNANQINTDGDSLGDACDPDDDDDGETDTTDNCPLAVNPGQADIDSDGIGDACDPTDDTDSDGDSVPDRLDNCVSVPNTDQLDGDGDNIGDACEVDVDGDGSQLPQDCDDADATVHPSATEIQNGKDDDCDGTTDEGFEDDDSDTVINTLDNCPSVPNSDQLNTDGDTPGDACDADDDNDTVTDATDNCPVIVNGNQLNTDGDAEGDVCDADDDNDAVTDATDNCPLIVNGNQLNTDGDTQGDACDTDDDNDGDLDTADNCPLVANGNQLNTDGDTQGDACDTDDDNDGDLDTADNCPLVVNGNQLNTDGDAQGDACDTDDDNDGDLDTADNCPINANGDQLNTDGDALGNACDTDDDNDGDLDTADNCPLVANPDQANANPADGVGDACDDKWSIALSVTPASSGTVTGAGANLVDGTSRTVTASPAAGYRFVKWTEGGVQKATTAGYTFPITANRTLVANFVRVHTVSVSASPTTGGTVTGGGTFDQGSSRTVVATAKPGFEFARWLQGGALASNFPSYTFTLAANQTLIAQFRVLRRENDLLADFGTSGLQRFLNNATWTTLHTSSPVAIAAGDLDGSGLDEAIGSFSSSGLWARYNNGATWTRLDTNVAARLAVGDFDGNGRDDIVADRGATGIWVLRNNTAPWVRLHTVAAQGLTTGDLDGDGRDELLGDFSSGLWAIYNGGTTWTRLDTTSPLLVVTGDLDGNRKDEVIVGRGAAGFWVRYNNAGGFVRIHTVNSEGLATGDVDGDGKEDLLVDFGASGLYVRMSNTATWTKLHASNPVAILAADLDRTGKAKVIADFGATGLFVRYNNAGAFVQKNTLSSQALAAGGFD